MFVQLFYTGIGFILCEFWALNLLNILMTSICLKVISPVGDCSIATPQLLVGSPNLVSSVCHLPVSISWRRLQDVLMNAELRPGRYLDFIKSAIGEMSTSIAKFCVKPTPKSSTCCPFQRLCRCLRRKCIQCRSSSTCFGICEPCR